MKHLDATEASFVARLPTNAKSRADDVRQAFGILRAFTDKAAAIRNDGNLSHEGRRAAAAKAWADGPAAHLAQLKDRTKSELLALQSRRASLVPTKPSDESQIGEMRRQELRSFLRSLPLGERHQMAMSDDPEITEAIIFSPAALSGLGPDAKQKVLERFIEARHGDAMRTIAAEERELENVGAAIAVCEQQASSLAGVEIRGAAA